MAATEADVKLLREQIDEPDTTSYSDEVLLTLLDSNDGDVDATSYRIWRAKAARFSTLVDTTESGSSRRNSQLHTNALKMVDFYSPKSVEEIAETSGPFTQAVTRA